jgi:hypothetical protein
MTRPTVRDAVCVAFDHDLAALDVRLAASIYDPGMARKK